MISLLGLDPATYEPSRLHGPDRIFRESNCYVDLWIELLHALGIDPASMMAFACAVDFEGDQWTFFKPPPEDLQRLYGIDVHEMQLYRPVADHVVEQLRAGRTVVIEVDSFYLADREATTYRRAHVKSSIAIEAIEPAAERLRYFHGPGYYELSGEDYRGVFRLGRKFSDDVLPPYTEIVRFDRGSRLEGDQLRSMARKILEQNIALRPRRNPWLVFGERLTRDLACLLAGGEAAYHAYAFATIRQCGSAFEAAKSFLEWLAAPPCEHARMAADAFERQAADSKLLLLKLARRRSFNPEPIICSLAEQWEQAMSSLEFLTSRADTAVA